MLPRFSSRRRFSDLSDQEILGLAISSEEDDSRIYRSFAGRIRAEYPATAAVFEGMAAEEEAHAQRLIKMHQRRFGNEIPLIRREHVADFYTRKPVWLMETLSVDDMREQTELMEQQAERFYRAAAQRTTDADTRALLDQLAAAETAHEHAAEQLADTHLTEAARDIEAETAHRQFVLTWVQPGLAGLMDGSVSTLAPIFAAAFATHDTMQTFRVGLAAAVGAGISMGFTEAASDDGRISGRGAAWKRGLASGVMTAVGGLGHALPYLIPHFWTATTIAGVIVFVELWSIAWIQERYMDTPFLRAALQVVLGGSLVLAAGIIIGAGG